MDVGRRKAEPSEVVEVSVAVVCVDVVGVVVCVVHDKVSVGWCRLVVCRGGRFLCVEVDWDEEEKERWREDRDFVLCEALLEEACAYGLEEADGVIDARDRDVDGFTACREDCVVVDNVGMLEKSLDRVADST